MFNVSEQHRFTLRASETVILICVRQSSQWHRYLSYKVQQLYVLKKAKYTQKNYKICLKKVKCAKILNTFSKNYYSKIYNVAINMRKKKLFNGKIKYGA